MTGLRFRKIRTNSGKKNLKYINLLKMSAYFFASEQFLEKKPPRFWNNWLGSHFAEEDLRVVVNH